MKRRRSATLGRLNEVPECLACGACCFADLPYYVPVRGDDHLRLGDAAEALTTWRGTRCFMAMRDGHCAALQVDTDAGHFVCSVYPDRPDTCRTLARGSAECAGERHQKYARTRTRLPVV